MDEKDKIILEIRERLTKIETLLNTEVDTLKARITKLETKLEDNRTWFIRQLLISMFSMLTGILVFYITLR